MPDDASAPDGMPLAHALLGWYAAHRRDLPWRRTNDPYRIWVAEVLLQQTRVSAAIPYYERLIERFASIEALASADLAQVLALWQGLGYYARARNLHRAARLLVDRYNGQLPADREALLSIPGIGEYTASALLSIAFGQDAIALDGNLKRILARLFDYGGEITQSSAGPILERHARTLLPPGHAREFNQAFMDLGSAVCLPAMPRCDACPIAPYCLARQRGVQQLRPVRARRSAIPTVEMLAAYIARQDGRLMLARRRPQGLLGGLWELPATSVSLQDSESPTAALAELLRHSLGIDTQPGDELLTVNHAYTHFRVRVRVYAVRTCCEPVLSTPEPWDALAWLARDELADHGLTGVTVKILNKLDGLQPPSG